MYFVSDKCIVGGVGSYCQLLSADCDLFLISPDNVVPQFILTPLSISLDPLLL